IETQISFSDLYRQRRANQARGNGVGDSVDTDRAFAGDVSAGFLGLGKAAGGQGSEGGQLLGDLARVPLICLLTDLSDEDGIVGFARKLSGTAQHQMAADPALQMSMRSLNIAVLIGGRNVDGPRLNAEMTAELSIVFVERASLLTLLDRVSGCGTAVRLQG